MTRVARSAMWLGLSNAVISIVNIIRSIALARLLTPEAFGLMGIASIVIHAIETVTRPGVAQALIARKGDFDSASGTAFTLLVGRGVLLAVVLAAVASLIATFYDTAELEPMLKVLAMVFIIGGFSSIQIVGRQREIDFRRLAYLGQLSSLGATAVTITCAFVLRNVWALVAGQVAAVTINVLLSYAIVGGRPSFQWDRKIARELLHYGKFITGSSIVLLAATEIDSAVIGKVLGVEQLGFYALAITTANLATTNLSKVASSVLMPAYSKLQADLPALRRAFLQTVNLTVLFILPAAWGLILVADPLVQVLFGDRWLPAADPLRILAAFGLLRALAVLNGYLFEGIGVPKIAFKIGLIRLAVILLLLFPLIRRWGLDGAAVAVTAGMGCQWLAGLASLGSTIDIRLRDYFKALWRPAWSAIATMAAVFASLALIESGTAIRLAIAVLAGLIVFSVINVPLVIRFWREKQARI